MYKAIIEVGGYKVGDEVPTEKAEAWNKAFAVPHCEKCDGESKGVAEAEKKHEEAVATGAEDEVENDSMLDDYLGRNEGVVKKNIKNDKLTKKQLEGLLELEKSGKKRTSIIVAIKNKLKRLEN